MNNKSYDIKLCGHVLALAIIGTKDNSIFDQEEIITFYGTLNGEYHPDWQSDANSWHDEGQADYDIQDFEPIADDEFEVINYKGDKLPNKYNRIIKKIIRIFDENLEQEI